MGSLASVSSGVYSYKLVDNFVTYNHDISALILLFACLIVAVMTLVIYDQLPQSYSPV